MAKRSQPAAVDGGAPAERAGDLSAPEHLDRIIAELAACEAKGDNELTRHAGRKLLAVMACAADALLLDGGKTLQAAPDKVGAFFEKSAAGFLATLDGLHKRIALTEAAALAASDIVPARSRADDPLAGAIAAWGSPAIPPTRSGAG
jgi:hypothetical protein